MNNNYFMETTNYSSMLPSFRGYEQQKELERFYEVQRQAAFQQQLALEQMVLQKEQYEQYQRKLAHIHTNAISEETRAPNQLKRGDQTGKAQKRAEHNAIERARRESLNSKFQQLAHSLPNLQDDRRPSKGTIIERTLEFVKETVQKEENFQQEIDHLREANRTLFLQMADSDEECYPDDDSSSTSSSVPKTSPDISSPPDLDLFYNKSDFASYQDHSYMTQVMLDANQFYF